MGTYQAAEAKPPKSTMDVPANVAAEPVSESKNGLQWDYSSNKVDGFRIERSTSPDRGFSEVATTGDAKTSYLDAGLASETTYYYRMRAFKRAGKDTTYSSYSETVSATTAAAADPGSFGFDVASNSVDEGAGTVAITIQRLGGSAGTVTVDWKTNSNSATYGADYSDFDWTTLTFADGETSKTETVAIVDDSEVESNETFDVLLGNPSGGATLDTITTSTITITDNDETATASPGSFEFDMSSYSADEGAGTVSVTINRVGGSDGTVTVDWKTQSDTATYGADYGDFDWTTLTFADGETSKTETVAIVDDSEVESDETFDVLLGNPAGGATLDTITASTITITDNDETATTSPGSFGFDVASYSVDEGAGTVSVAINRLGGSDGIVTVDWKTQSDTATWGADYGDFAWTTLTFADGETSKTETVAIVDDTDVESNETFDVLLGNPSGGATLDTITASTITITDNDEIAAANPSPGSFEFDMSSYSVDEGAGTVSVTINRVGGSDGTATVDWKTQSDTATWGADYGDFEWTTLTFADGETSKTETVAIVDDTEVESDETFDLVLGNAAGGATMGSITTSMITITDNDETATASPSPGSFEFDMSSYSVDEGAGTVSVTINRVGGSDGTVTVDWKTQSDTAKWGADYGDFGWTTLTFADGETSKTKTVAIVDDTEVESEETFDLLLGNAAGGATLGSITTTTVSIVDNDESSTTDSSSTDSSTTETDSNLGYLPVFPGAKGFGTETKAGRGGQIIKVTNLNDSGSGSLRAAVSATGPRIVVFEVSGTINLTSNLVIKNPYITIAGQTAPSPGVTLKGAGFAIFSHDVLIQHLRIRVGDFPDGPSAENRDGCVVYDSSGYNVVVDHVSISWHIDKGTSNWGNGVKNVTFTNSIISEGLQNSIHPEGSHSVGSLVGDYGENISFIGNLWAHNEVRNPAFKGDTHTVTVNNVMYDAGPWAFMYMVDDFGRGPSTASIAGNVLIEGPSSDTTKGIVIQSSVKSGTKIYLSDNSFAGTFWKNNAGFDPRVSSPPVWHPSIVLRDSSTVESSVLANAGARPADRDAVDARIVNEVKSRTGNIIDSQQEVGGWPSLAKNYRAFDAPANPNGDDDGDGYTNVEEVLHQMAAQLEGRN